MDGNLETSAQNRGLRTSDRATPIGRPNMINKGRCQTKGTQLNSLEWHHKPVPPHPDHAREAGKFTPHPSKKDEVGGEAMNQTATMWQMETRATKMGC